MICTCGQTSFNDVTPVTFKSGKPIVRVWRVYECVACSKRYLSHPETAQWVDTTIPAPPIPIADLICQCCNNMPEKASEYEFYSTVMQATGASLEEVQAELARAE